MDRGLGRAWLRISRTDTPSYDLNLLHAMHLNRDVNAHHPEFRSAEPVRRWSGGMRLPARSGRGQLASLFLEWDVSKDPRSDSYRMKLTHCNEFTRKIATRLVLFPAGLAHLDNL